MGDDQKDTQTLEPTEQGLADPRMSSMLIIGVGVVTLLGLAGLGFALDRLNSEMRAEHQALRNEMRERTGRQPSPPLDPASLTVNPPPVERADLLTTRATSFAPTVRAGRVSQVTGSLDPGPAVGDRCVVEVWPTGERFDDSNCRIEVYCGDYELYGISVGRPEGDTWAWNLCAVRDGAPTYAHDMDETLPEGDPRLVMRLPENRVIVSDADPEFAVEIRLDDLAAASRQRPRDLFRPMDFEPEVRFGSVALATGYAGVSTGDSCTVEVWPSEPTIRDNPFNARVSVRCAATDLYGPEIGVGGNDWGWVRIGVSDGRATRAFDSEPTGDEEDPALEIDLPARRVIVSDGPGQRVEIQLER